MDNVRNKTAIVTGGGAGIGYCVIEELLRKGAKKVAIIDLPIVPSYTATVSLQEKYGKERVVFFPTDVTNMETFNDTFKQAVKALDGLDILVNNAGICNELRIEQTFALNVVALIRGSLLGLDYMGKHKGGKGGTIINMASLAGLFPYEACPVYSSSKHAVVGFSLNLMGFYNKTNVRILTMCPGFTKTPLLQSGNPHLDIIDDNVIRKCYHEPQSATHVGQSVVEVIQKGENGSFWIVQFGEPPYSFELHPPKLRSVPK